MNHKIINLPIYIFWKLQLNYHFLFVRSVSVLVLTKYTLSLTSAWPSNMQNVATGQPLPPNRYYIHKVRTVQPHSLQGMGKTASKCAKFIRFLSTSKCVLSFKPFPHHSHKTLWNVKHKEVLRTEQQTVAGSTFGLLGEEGLIVKPGTRKITNCLPSHFCKVLIQYKQEVSD